MTNLPKDLERYIDEIVERKMVDIVGPCIVDRSRVSIVDSTNVKIESVNITEPPSVVDILIECTDDCYQIPTRKREGDIGYDCYAAEDVYIESGQVGTVSLGFKLAPPEGWAVFLLPRSGLSCQNITLSNAPGLGDPNFTGVYKAIVANHNEQRGFNIERGARICQLIAMPVPEIEFTEIDELPENIERGEDGFGSSGV